MAVLIGLAARMLQPLPGAAAEPFLDLYLGTAWTEDAEGSADLFYVYPPQRTSRTAKYDPSTVVGGRLGGWSETLPWLGAALDLSTFQADSDITDITVVPLSLLVMLRWPLWREPDLPGGRVQPYVGAGWSFICYDMDIDLRPLVNDNVSAAGFDDGWDLRGGVAWQLHRHFALFGEYRYLHFHLNYERESLDWLLGYPSSTTARVDTDIDTHQFFAGLSYRF